MNKNKDFTYKNLENGGDSVKSEENIITKAVSKKVSRRTFIKTAAVAGGVAAATGAINIAQAVDYDGERGADNVSGGTVVYKRSGCWGCAFGCGIQVRTETIGGKATATKIDGNPYDTVTNDLNISTVEVQYDSVAEPVKNPGKICAKGQAMLKELYDPYRVLTPLKRVGARGSGQWEAITWGTAIEEIANGGNLPTNTGVGTYAFEGLKQIKGDGTNLAGSHTDIHSSIRTDTGETYNVGKGNRVVWTDGRNQQGTQGRFLTALGANRHDHSSVCNGNWKSAWKNTLGEYIHRPDFQSTGALATDYVVYVGANPFEAEQGLNYIARRLTSLMAAGTTKLVVLDPRLSVSAAKANQYDANALSAGSKWIRIKQGGDGAFALGMIKRWFANGDIDDTNAHLKATRTTGTKLNHTNAAYLVEVATAAYPFGKISANVVDAVTGDTVAGSTVDNGALDPVGAASPASGEYDSDLYQGTVYQLLKARVASLTWADIHAATDLGANAGATQAIIEGIADDFWGADRPVAFSYRGATQHSAGYYTALSWMLVNVLRDVVDRPGGLVLQEWNYDLNGAAFLDAGTAPTGAKPRIDRAPHGTSDGIPPSGHEDNTLRPWTKAATNGCQQEVFPGEAIGYPFRARAHIFYAHNPVYTHHVGAHDVAGVLTQAEGSGYWIPLTVNMTTTLNETAELCDYVLPESTWAERWTMAQSPYGGPLAQRATIRRPIVGSYEEITVAEVGGANPRTTYMYAGPFSSVNVTGTKEGAIAHANALDGPLQMEDILILLGKRLRELGDANFNGFGLNGQSAGNHYDSDYQRVAKIFPGSDACGGGAWTESLYDALAAIDADTSITAAAAATALDFAGKAWRKYLWMGGRRANANAAVAAGQDNLYQGGSAGTKDYVASRKTSGGYTRKKIWASSFEGIEGNYMDGEFHDQLPPVTKTGGVLDIAITARAADGTNINAVTDAAAAFAFTVTSNKLAIHTQSRTSNNEWLRELEPTNYVVVPSGSLDSAGTALEDGQTVTVEANYSADGINNVSVQGTILVSDTLKSGTVYISHAFGRWASGADSFTVGGIASTNGKTGAASYDSQGNFLAGTIGAGYGGQLALNNGTAHGPIGRRDPALASNGGGGLTDIGGGHGMYATKVKITI